MRRNRAIEFASLEVLVTLAEARSFSEAAKRLRITQSAVSQAIKQLEESTQSTLVIRRSKPLSLTQSGERLLSYAHTVFEQTNAVVNELATTNIGQINQLNIGMIDSFADSLALPVVAGIKQHVKRVSLRTGISSSLSEAFQSRTLDVLISADTLADETRIQRLKLIRDPFVVITPASHRRLRLSKLATSLPFIHYSPESTIGGQTDIIARRLNIKLDTQYEFDSTQSVIRFVQQQHGWAILSAMCLVRYADLLDNVAVLNLEEGKHAREISLIARSKEWRELPSTIASISKIAFDDSLKTKLKKIRPWLVQQAYVI